MFVQGVKDDDFPESAEELFVPIGFVYGGFRSLLIPERLRIFPDVKKVFLVRDPRDIATSYYFSVASSHLLPPEGTYRNEIEQLRRQASMSDINEYILAGKVDWILANANRLVSTLPKAKNYIIFRYEDIIFDKQNWSAKLAEYLEIQLPAAIREQITSKHDIRPTHERASEHIRQVAPGNYKKHLSDEAIRHIETVAAPVFSFLGYELKHSVA
jgi:hypothetical protein